MVSDRRGTTLFPMGSSMERIEKTKRSKNDQKPIRNGKKTKSQEQDKESARNHSRISPTQSKKGTKKSKVNTIKSRAISDKFSKFEGLL
ncbi:hypothetical protein Tco_0760255 [Tanacetum coccineum]